MGHTARAVVDNPVDHADHKQDHIDEVTSELGQNRVLDIV